MAREADDNERLVQLLELRLEATTDDDRAPRSAGGDRGPAPRPLGNPAAARARTWSSWWRWHPTTSRWRESWPTRLTAAGRVDDAARDPGARCSSSWARRAGARTWRACCSGWAAWPRRAATSTRRALERFTRRLQAGSRPPRHAGGAGAPGVRETAISRARGSYFRSLLLQTFDEKTAGVTKAEVYLALGRIHLQAGESPEGAQHVRARPRGRSQERGAEGGAGGRPQIEEPAAAPLLAPDEPAPYELFGSGGKSPFVIACDHAGRLLPRALGNLGLSPSDLERHIAWDIGARDVARRLGEALDAVVITQRYSRLAIDCNRRIASADSIVTRSERTEVPGNCGLSPAEAERRARALFHPYHDQIRAQLDSRQAAGRPSIFVAVHSFTPVFLDVGRRWHAGVLYIRDGRLAEPLLHLLRAEPGLAVGCNEPYRADELCDFSIVQHGERRGIPYVELEIRQDLITTASGQSAWAARLARLLPLAAAHLGTT